MANDQAMLKELLESSLSHVEDYAASIRETVEDNLAPDNIAVVHHMNSALLCIADKISCRPRWATKMSSPHPNKTSSSPKHSSTRSNLCSGTTMLPLQSPLESRQW